MNPIFTNEQMNLLIAANQATLSGNTGLARAFADLFRQSFERSKVVLCNSLAQ